MQKNHFLNHPAYWLLGFFSTASCVAFIFSGRVLALFMLMLIPVFADLVIHYRWGETFKVRSRPERHYYIWMIISIFSTIVGYLYFSAMPEWSSTTMSYMPKILIYLLLLFLLMGNEDRDGKTRSIANGLKIGILVNIIWSIADAALYYTAGFSLTNRMFAGYIEAMDIRYGQLSLIKSDGQFRSGGLNGDPANIGLFATILAAYSLKARKTPYYILSILGTLSSVSMIAVVGIIAVTLIHLFHRRERRRRMTRRQTLYLFFASVVIIGLVVTNTELVEKMAGSVNTRVEMKLNTSETEGDNYRLQYYKNFLPAVLDEPMYLLTGTGYMTASYPYLIHGYTSEEFFPYDPEMTYFSNYFYLGLTGFIFFLIFYLEIYALFRRRIYLQDATDMDYLIYAGLLGSLIAFFGYHYSLYSVVMLLSICAVSHGDTLRVRKKQENHA